MSYYCDDHYRWFKDWHSYSQHMSKHSEHNWCSSCNEDFSSDDGLRDHFTSSSSHYYCSTCNILFSDDNDLQNHFRAYHIYCSQCRRFFNSESNLRNHLNSALHRPRTFPCPKCDKAFTSPANVILHLESGYCPSGINRAIVNREVLRRDKNHIITDASRLLTGPETQVFSANSRSWNGYAYECYLCHNTFRALNALNQHLASPRHQDKMYFCPLSTCKTRFVTLSGLWQHVESESCGILKFNSVKRAMDQLVGGVTRRLTM